MVRAKLLKQPGWTRPITAPMERSISPDVSTKVIAETNDRDNRCLAKMLMKLDRDRNCELVKEKPRQQYHERQGRSPIDGSFAESLSRQLSETKGVAVQPSG